MSLLAVVVPRDYGSCVQRRMIPGQQLDVSKDGFQTHYAWAQGQEPDGEFEQGAREGGIVDVGRRESKQQRQAGATTEQGMQTVATQERTGMMGWGMADSRVGIGPPPGQDRRAVHD